MKLKTSLNRNEVDYIISRIIDSDTYANMIGHFFGELKGNQFKMYKIPPVGQVNSFNPITTGKIFQKENYVLIHIKFLFGRAMSVGLILLTSFTIIWTIGNKSQYFYQRFEMIPWTLAFVLFALYRFHFECNKIRKCLVALFDAEIV